MRTQSLKSLASLELWIVLMLQLLFPCQSIDSQTETEIDTFITDVFMESINIPGLGLTIVEDNGNTVLAKGYGFQDLERGLTVTNETKFAIASITKTFTAVLVVKVLSEKFPDLGASALDIPLNQLYPDSNVTFSDRYRSETMTFRDLLSHRHGIRDSETGMNTGSSEDLAEFAYRTRYAKESVPFRTYGNYNNAMYSLTGKIIGELAGSNYYQLLENLLQELGMTDSTYVKELEDYGTLPNMSKGYYSKDGRVLPFNSSLLNRLHVAVPAGGVISTPADMAKYISFHLNLGRVGDKQIVSEEAMNWLIQPALALNLVHFKESESDKIDGQLAVGTGFSISVYDGWIFHHHSGTWSPFTSRMVLYPAAKLGIFSVANGPSSIHEAQYNFEYLHREIFNLVQQGVNLSDRHFYKKPTQPVQEDTLGKFKPRNISPNVEIRQSNLAGIFGNPMEGDMELTFNEGTIQTFYMKLGKWATGYLTPYQGLPSTYLINWDSDIEQDFYFATGTSVDILIDFQDENTLFLVFGPQQFEFKRGETLDTFPEIPWAVGSCGPEEN